MKAHSVPFVFATILLYGPLFATSLISVFCKDHIAIAVDTGQTGTNAGTRAIKSVLLRNRFVVGTVHLIELHQKVEGNAYDYDFVQWMDAIDHELGEAANVADLAHQIEKHAKATFPRFGELIKRGVLRKEMFNGPGDLVTFMVVGYQGGLPECYVIKVWIVWDKADTSNVSFEKIDVDLKGGLFFQASGSRSVKDLAAGNGERYDRVRQLIERATGSLNLSPCQAVAVAVVKRDSEVDPQNVQTPIRLITLKVDTSETREIR